MKPIVCVDLDDTLMLNGFDYTDAKDEFLNFTSDKANVSQDVVREAYNKSDTKNVEKYGLRMERFPESMVDAFVKLVDSPVETDIETVRNIGYSVYKTPEEYAKRGFMGGAEKFLTILNEEGVHLHLITAGDERVQQRKIDGLNLQEYFTNVHITPIGTKHEQIQQLLDTYDCPPKSAYHVGNSLKSDIKAAITAGINAVHIPRHEWQNMDNEEYYRTHTDVTRFDSMEQLVEVTPHFFLQNKITQ